MKKVIIKFVSVVLLLSSLIAILVIPASATAEKPDGGSILYKSHLGTEKTAYFILEEKAMINF